MTLGGSHDGRSSAEKCDRDFHEKDSLEHNEEDLEKRMKDIGEDQSNADTGQEKSNDGRVGAESSKYPGHAKLLLIGVGVWFAIFLYSLDQTIVANAIPTITDEFHSTSDEGWYGSGYLLTVSAFQLFYGRIYSNFSIKYTFITAIGIFELGSLICALAPTSIALIIGRAVAGLGGSGIGSGAFIIIAHSFPPRIRPVCIASMAAVYAIAAVVGPILGGVFTTNLSWRWCFWINLPFGGVTVLAILLVFPDPERPDISAIPVVQRLRKLDLIGLLLFIPTVVCLLLALEWGGSTYSWSSGRIIALLVLFSILLITFVLYERWKGPEAAMPIRVITQRSVAAATWNAFCNGGALFTLIYFLPYWQQVIRDQSAAQSGVRMLPFVMGVVIVANLSGFLVSKFGYYAPFMLFSSVLTPIGEGLLTTWTISTGFSMWVGYQAITGIGLGAGAQQPQVVIQTVLPKSDIPAGASIVMLVQTISGAIFVSVGQSVLQNEFVKSLHATVPGSVLDASKLATVGTTQLRTLVPPKYLEAVLIDYNGALTKVYLVTVVMSAMTIIGSALVEWKSTKAVKD